MAHFEYKVVPAHVKGRKARGLRRSEDKFAYSVQEVMNEMAQEGWEYLRSETLPHEERSGLTGKSTTFRSVLVFRRSKAPDGPAKEVLEEETLPVIEAEVVETLTPSEQPEPDIDPQPAKTISVPMDDDEDEDYPVEKVLPKKPDASAIPSALRRRASQKRKKRDVAAE